LEVLDLRGSEPIEDLHRDALVRLPAKARLDGVLARGEIGEAATGCQWVDAAERVEGR
jgi:hypothetical protein